MGAQERRCAPLMGMAVLTLTRVGDPRHCGTMELRRGSLGWGWGGRMQGWDPGQSKGPWEGSFRCLPLEGLQLCLCGICFPSPDLQVLPTGICLIPFSSKEGHS